MCCYLLVYLLNQNVQKIKQIQTFNFEISNTTLLNILLVKPIEKKAKFIFFNSIYKQLADCLKSPIVH
ncbi:MAG: hypothetical protein ACJAVE_001919 [Polaribacter sp.]|jgi:hypothetical protein